MTHAWIWDLWGFVSDRDCCRPEMRFVPAVTSLNVDGFNVCVVVPWQLFAVFSASRHFIQLKLPCVTFMVPFFITLPIVKDTCNHNNKSMTLPKKVDCLFSTVENGNMHSNEDLFKGSGHYWWLLKIIIIIKPFLITSKGERLIV